MRLAPSSPSAKPLWGHHPARFWAVLRLFSSPPFSLPLLSFPHLHSFQPLPSGILIPPSYLPARPLIHSFIHSFPEQVTASLFQLPPCCPFFLFFTPPLESSAGAACPLISRSPIDISHIPRRGLKYQLYCLSRPTTLLSFSWIIHSLERVPG